MLAMLINQHTFMKKKTTPKITNPHITDCKACGYVTSIKYAEGNKGKCRPCTTGEKRRETDKRQACTY